MRISKFLLLEVLTLVTLLVASYLLFFRTLELHMSLKSFLRTLLWGDKRAEEIERNISSENIGEANKSIEKSASSGITNESYQVDKGTQISSTEKESYIKPLTLKIVDICSGKLVNVFSISEGTRKCLNLPSPYTILLEKNSTHFISSILNENGFNETFDINDTVLIYFLFAEDVATISKEIEKIYLEGSDYFFLGNYELQTIWELDSSRNLYISKMVVILPLYVKKEVENGDYSLLFYLSALNKTFYLGGTKILTKVLE